MQFLELSSNKQLANDFGPFKRIPEYITSVLSCPFILHIFELIALGCGFPQSHNTDRREKNSSKPLCGVLLSKASATAIVAAPFGVRPFVSAIGYQLN